MKLEIAIYKRKKKIIFSSKRPSTTLIDINIQLTDVLQNNFAQRKWYTETSEITARNAQLCSHPSSILVPLLQPQIQGE